MRNKLQPFLSKLAAFWREHAAITVILALFAALGVIYSLSTPLLEGPDEMWHYPYVKYIADGKGLPQQPEPATGPEEALKSEFHQPPLYYALGALVTFPINTDDLELLMQRNPYWGYRARAPEADNKNIFLHTDRERWPFRGAVLAIYIVRWLSVLISAATVVGTYLIGLEVFPARKYLAIGAAALVAFTPQFLYLSGTVNNDNLLAPLCAFTVWLLAGLIRGKDGWPRLLALGALIGLALLTKWTALALLPLAGLVLVYRVWQHRSWRKFLRESCLVFGLALALSGWWFWRNQSLYSDPLGIGRKMQIFPPRSPVPTARDLIAELPRKEISYWACFGWENVYADPWVYPVLRAFTYIGLLGLLSFIFWSLGGHSQRNRNAPGHITPQAGHDSFDRTTWAHLSLLGLWCVFIFAAFVRWMIYTEAAVGRHLFPAAPCGMLLLLLGWTWFLPRRYGAYLTACFGTALFLLAAIAPHRYIRPTYAPPPRYTAAKMPDISHPLDVIYDHKVHLLGYKMSSNAISPGETLQVTLYWEVLASMTENYSVFVHLVNEGGSIVAQRDSHPGLGSYPTSLWRVGEIIEDTYPVPIPPEAHTPARLRLLTGFYLLATMQRLPVVNEAIHEGNAAEVTWIELRAAQ